MLVPVPRCERRPKTTRCSPVAACAPCVVRRHRYRQHTPRRRPGTWRSPPHTSVLRVAKHFPLHWCHVPHAATYMRATSTASSRCNSTMCWLPAAASPFAWGPANPTIPSAGGGCRAFSRSSSKAFTCCRRAWFWFISRSDNVRSRLSMRDAFSSSPPPPPGARAAVPL